MQRLVENQQVGTFHESAGQQHQSLFTTRHFEESAIHQMSDAEHVHPFNAFSTINVDIANSGKITVKTKKVYDDFQIEYIERYIEDFIRRFMFSTTSS